MTINSKQLKNSAIKNTLLSICVLLSVWIPYLSYADTSSVKLKAAYDTHINKLEAKWNAYSSKFIYNLADQIEDILQRDWIAANKRDIIEQLAALNNEEILSHQLIEEKKSFQSIYNRYEVSQDYNKKVYNQSAIFIEQWVWYFYKYNAWSSFEDESHYTSSNLRHNNLAWDNILLSVKDNRLVFVREFEKVKLIDDSIIAWVQDKYSFLQEVRDDKRFLSSDTDNYFIQLKSDTQALIWDEINHDIKVQKIYDFVLSRISYTQNLNLEDRKIFSGILSYANQDGVCEWYAKLMVYMLAFAGISDYEVIRGHVIDANDFPDIWHAWVRIGQSYYDPTFDDPLGLTQTREAQDYIYYNLPKDLFYTNRFNFSDTPEFLKTRTMKFRKDYINQKLSRLLEKYKQENYLLLQPLAFKTSIGLAYNQAITIRSIESILPQYNLIDNKLYQNSEQQNISGYKYYSIDDSNIESLLQQLNYQLDDFVLIRWEDQSYALAYDLE